MAIRPEKGQVRSPENRRAGSHFRLLGVLPLLFFCGQAIHYWRLNELGHVLWMCNIGNLILALGLFIGQPMLIRVAVIWSIPGLAAWFRYVVTDWFHYLVVMGWLRYIAVAWGGIVSSTLAHVGGLVVGLIALSRVGMNRGAWLYALGWYLVIQLASRLFTPAELNVNVSHNIYAGWERSFGAYWKFWMLLTILVALTLWGIESVLRRLWRANSDDHMID